MLLLRMMLGKLELWQWLLMTAVIIPCAVRDIRTKRINGYICIMGILAAFLIRERFLGEESRTILIDSMRYPCCLSVRWREAALFLCHFSFP